MNMSENISNDVAGMQPANASRTGEFVGQLLRIFAVLGVVSLLALAAALAFMLGVGHWLAKENSLQKANAMAVLSVHFPARALGAAALYRIGYARDIWLTHALTAS